MPPAVQRRLLQGALGLMIKAVMPFPRVVGTFVAASLVASLAASPARAQAQEDGWFDDGSGSAAAPAGPGTPGVPASPAAPGVPNRPAEPQSLAPSPLLEPEAQGAQPVNTADPEDRDPRALTQWSSYVDPYGTWVDDPRYGRVWLPSGSVVGSDFAPYSSGGHWSLDENEDWVWVSDYPFGWVTFHYGRWVWISGRGWAWIPGMRYAPAWVTWRAPIGSYAYVGWAPLGPSYVWFGGGAVFWGYAPIYPWVFCPSEYVFSHHVHGYIVHDHVVVGYAARYTRPYYVAAPRAGGGYRTAAAPHGPSPSAAHVPPRSVPLERVSSRAIATRGSAATTSFARTTFQSRSLRQSPGLQPTFNHGVPSSRSAPTRQGFDSQRFEPQRSSGLPRSDFPRAEPRLAPQWNNQRNDSAPRQPAPRMEPRFTPERMQPAPRLAPHFNGGGHSSRVSPSFGGSRMGGHSSGGGHMGGGHMGGGHTGGGHSGGGHH